MTRSPRAGPRRLSATPCLVVDQVLADFDAGMRQTDRLGMMVDREILRRLAGSTVRCRRPGIRPRVNPLCTNISQAVTRSESHSTPISQGRDSPLSTGVKLCIGDEPIGGRPVSLQALHFLAIRRPYGRASRSHSARCVFLSSGCEDCDYPGTTTPSPNSRNALGSINCRLQSTTSREYSHRTAVADKAVRQVFRVSAPAPMSSARWQRRATADRVPSSPSDGGKRRRLA